MKSEKRDFGNAFIFAVLFTTLACVSIGTISAATTHYVNPGESIQTAVDNANAGDTIIVRAGTYTENVEVNVNHLTIKSENGYDSTIVQAASTSDHVFEVTADYVNITGFTVTGATGDYKGGIYLYGAENCNIANNNASNNYRGIYLYSSSNYNSLSNNAVKGNDDYGIIMLSSSSNNMLMNNTAEDNKCGIYLSSSSNNTLRDNKVMYNGNTGIYLKNSSNNRIIDNEASNSVNYDGIYLNSANNNELRNNIVNYNNDKGIELMSSNENIITNNTAKKNTNTCICLKNSSNNRIIDNEASNSANYNGISLSSSNDNEIRNNTANSNHYNGIILWTSSEHNTIANNTAKGNGASGIKLKTSNENTIANNTAKNNGNNGIYLTNSNNNEIYLNNFMNNANNAYSTESTNVWNSPSKITYFYHGNTYTNYMGNYWGDYTGTDGNGDGLGDSSYSIDSDKDDYPLMQQWVYYFAPQPTEFRVHNINTGKDFYTIQAAIDDSATNDGDTITVDPGTYNENVDVTKSLTIWSTSGNPADTIVQAASTSDHVFRVTADYVNIYFTPPQIELFQSSETAV